MRIKYIGLAPVTNIYGDWFCGDIKEVQYGAVINQANFVVVDDGQPVEKYIRKKVLREELTDKMERDNKEFIHRRVKK